MVYSNVEKQAIDRFLSGPKIQQDDVVVYLNSSKIALSRRSNEYLDIVDEQAQVFRDRFCDHSQTIDDKCNVILECTTEGIATMGWASDDIDGVVWFIGNFTDAMKKADVIDDYDTMFVKCFRKYFNL